MKLKLELAALTFFVSEKFYFIKKSIKKMYFKHTYQWNEKNFGNNKFQAEGMNYLKEELYTNPMKIFSLIFNTNATYKNNS